MEYTPYSVYALEWRRASLVGAVPKQEVLHVEGEY